MSPSGAGPRAHRRDIATRRHGARETARARAEKGALVELLIKIAKAHPKIAKEMSV